MSTFARVFNLALIAVILWLAWMIGTDQIDYHAVVDAISRFLTDRGVR